MNKKSMVTIGLPVFNGENFLEESIESILRQSFTDYQIVISDNGSTDGTQQICEHYSAKYDSIIYLRSEKNHGAAWNFRRVFEHSSSIYFKWMAHDDIIAPNYLEKCVTALEENPEAVLAYPLTKVIDSEGQIIQDYSFEIGTHSPLAHIRFRDLLFSSDQCYEVFGVIRSDCLRQTEVMGDYGHADGVLLGHLSLMGTFHMVPEPLFFSRRHASQSIKMHTGENQYGRPDYHAYTTWFNTTKKGRIIFPNWQILVGNFNAVRRSQIQLSEKINCYFYILKWIKRHRAFLIGDLLIAFKQLRSKNV
jgi:glycosyltransferase involved in cell wall biosynthesis